MQTSKQVKQLRGLKETLTWPLLTERKDTIPLLFPRICDTVYTPLMILERIIWPTHDEDSEASLEDTRKLTGFLRTFIGNCALFFNEASYNSLRFLMKFWTGWDVLPRSLDVEVVAGSLPKSSTCY